jgi:hypothetical protein
MMVLIALDPPALEMSSVKEKKRSKKYESDRVAMNIQERYLMAQLDSHA